MANRSSLKGGRIIATEAQNVDAIIEYLKIRRVPYARVTNTGVIIKDQRGTFFGKRKHDQRGIADILACWLGWPIAIEVKREGGKRSDEQIEWLAGWEKGGGVWMVATSVDQVATFLDSLSRQLTPEETKEYFRRKQ